AAPSPSAAGGSAPARAALGVEAVDAEKAGAAIVAVHVPGPGYTAGLVRGDVLLTFGGARIDSAADLVRAVGRTEPGEGVKVTVLHRGGGYQQLTVVPGVVV
ncbi:PDZ domain-containing protein, partial [Streptomyces sp. S6]